MRDTVYDKLNNPAWYSLLETHQKFAIGNDIIQRYPPSIAPFVASQFDKGGGDELKNWVKPNESFFIIGDLPLLPEGFVVESRLLCVQMICKATIKIAETATIEALTYLDEAQMTDLINRVQPGYYLPGTRLMGDYFGIRVNGHLVAITGERMRMHELTEISAVVTDPKFTGRGFAQQLIAKTVNKNIESGTIPFLHVAETNKRAIDLYTYLGFVQRRLIAFWKIKRV